MTPHRIELKLFSKAIKLQLLKYLLLKFYIDKLASWRSSLDGGPRYLVLRHQSAAGQR